MDYDKKDIPQFQEDICKKTCINNGSCLQENHDEHWYLMCPHYHSWKLQYSSFVWEQLRWEREHPEEVAKKKEQNKEVAKKMREMNKNNKSKKIATQK